MITVTTKAAQEVKRMQTSRQKPNSYLRLQVKKGGCSGFFYNLELDEKKGPKDHTCHSNQISIVIDAESAAYLAGLKIDYSEDLMGGGFRFENPQTTNPCRCGQSFFWQNP
jgi:iron-sulfur cluster assembly accessory protein